MDDKLFVKRSAKCAWVRCASQRAHNSTPARKHRSTGNALQQGVGPFSCSHGRTRQAHSCRLSVTSMSLVVTQTQHATSDFLEDRHPFQDTPENFTSIVNPHEVKVAFGRR